MLSKSYGNVSYSISSQAGEASLRYSQQVPPIEGSRPLDYFLGSGHLGTTYLYRLNGYLLESPVAYYSGSGLDLKPGISAVGKIANALPVEPACLRCHMSAVQHTDHSSVNHYESSPFLHTGITCEACHGDTSTHLSSRGKISAVDPARLDAARRDSVCISCHLEGDTTVEQSGKSALDYKPGDLISDYLSYFIFAGKESTERGVSEVEQFNLSMCKRKTGASMSCTNCHDPHFTPVAAQRVEFYRSKCLTCHSSTAFVDMHHPENRDCASCHMAKTGAANIPHVAWTDHRVLREPSQPRNLASSLLSREMVPLLGATPKSRDIALAYYQTSFKVGAALQAKAYSLLKAHEAELKDDPSAMDALGIIAGTRGDLAEARKDFEAVLSLHPEDFSASVNLGTLFARSGDLKQAITTWKLAFAHNEDVPGLAMNLALAQCRAGDMRAAEMTIHIALNYSPAENNLRDLLTSLPSCDPSRSTAAAPKQ